MPSTQNKPENDNKIGHYMLKELLVEQAVSGIYLAQDEKTEDLVFLLTLQPDAARTSDLAERFRRRAETLAQLEHETILPLLDHGVDGKRPYAVMAYRSGQFLAEYLETASRPDPNDKAKITEALQLVKRIAAGLAVTHPAGLIHHDLRPENVYLDDAGQPYLLDLVVPPTPPVITQLGEESITELDYQSPEQQAVKALSGRSNIYSLGILLYRLLAGHQPALPLSEWDIFEHKGPVREIPLNQVQPGLTAATYEVVQDSIWQKEWSRFETVNAQLRAIEQALAEESAPPTSLPIWLLLPKQLRQPKILRIIIPALVLLFLLIVVLLLLRGRANRQPDVTPTPEPAVLPLESETAVFPQPEETSTTKPSNTPTVTTAETDENTMSEDEVLPSVEETETPTDQPRPTATVVAATATQSTPTATSTPTVEVTPTPSPTETPTLEPTETACIPSPPFGWVRYSVQVNDSLSSLSQATNTTVERLMQVNCLDTILLSIDQRVWLPALPATATATPSATAVAPGPVPPGPNPTPVPSSTPPPQPA